MKPLNVVVSFFFLFCTPVGKTRGLPREAGSYEYPWPIKVRLGLGDKGTTTYILSITSITELYVGSNAPNTEIELT